MAIPSLKLSKLPYPHAPIGIVLNRRGAALWRNPGLVNFAGKNGLYLFEREGACVLLDESAKALANHECLFTGIAFLGGTLVFGADDRPLASALDGAYGEFSFCRFAERGIVELRTDYFGFGKWYYYIDDNHFAAASTYHLLLMMLSSCGIGLEMDIARSRVNLYEIGFGYTFGQQFSRRMDIKGTFVSLPTEKIEYHKNEHRVSRDKLPLYELISSPEPYDEDAYERAIFHGRDEICSNLRAVLESPRFDRVVIDLSGGFDSRVVYAAMTTMPKRLRNKAGVYIRSSHLSDDVPVGHAVNNLYGYEVLNSYETDTSDIFTDHGELELFNLSLELGGYANLEPMRKCDVDPRAIEIMGGGGDILFGFFRIYGDYARILEKHPDDDVIIEKIAANSAHPLGRACPSVVADAARLLKETLSEFPEHLHIYLKLHIFYLLFRNNSHFSGLKYQNNLLTLNVLHSKHALRAKWMYWSRFGRNDIPPEKVSIDMLSAINPLVAQMPFAAENDPFLPTAKDLLRPASLKLEPDVTVRPYKYMSAKPAGKTYSAKAREYTTNLENSRRLLQMIEEHHPGYAEVTDLLRGLLQKEAAEPAKAFPYKIINKILHVGYEISIVSGLNRGAT